MLLPTPIAGASFDAVYPAVSVTLPDGEARMGASALELGEGTSAVPSNAVLLSDAKPDLSPAAIVVGPHCEGRGGERMRGDERWREVAGDDVR